jgi:tetratricopeptide (TPR) repeat protein
MPTTFTFDLSQQHFELRCERGTRRLSSPELLDLIQQCEQHYYSGRPTDWYGRQRDVPTELVNLGRRLYHWLDGDEGWLRAILATGQPQTIAFDLTYSLEVQGLKPETERIALGLAHLPWELLHDDTTFLLQTQRLSIPPMRVVQRRTEARECANRPLHLLLMATAPEGIEPVLNYEQEEANIVQATQDQPLLLVVEESGSVSELKNRIRFYPSHYFDGFHLTGHGLIYTQEDYGWLAQTIPPMPQIADNTPCFITEDELGNVQLTTVPDLANAFGDRFPRLIFLSGCHTGEVPDQGSVPSMAQALVRAGAQVVLGWARPVFDRTAIVAAQALYRELAAGSSLEQAVKVTVAEMIREQCPDWHLLRVYCDGRELPPLVTPMGTPRRGRLSRIQPEQDFLDAQGEVKVAGEFAFIGRRRPLQRCLRAMKPTSDRVGVFIQGMGGLGKSTLAARICRRLQAQHPGFQRVVLVGVVNEATLRQKLSSAYEQFAEIPALLNEAKLSLKGQLQNFIKAVEELDRPLLLVLDDFEQNIPESAINDDTLRPTEPATKVLTDLCGALAAMQQEMSALSRVIVTCRYQCPFPRTLHLERLERMNPTDIDKKCRLLSDYTQVKQHPLYNRVIQVADGNPRLLNWLLDLLQQPEVDTAALLGQLEKEEQRFREDILAKKLLESLTQTEREFLARVSVFQLPVTQAILAAVVADLRPLEKTLALGLVESATTPREPEYRVTSILEPLLQPVLTEAEWRATQNQAAQATYRVWWQEAETSTEAKGLEVVRLALQGEVGEIAGAVGDAIGTNWNNSSRFLEALELYQAILAVLPTDPRILHGVARAEFVLGQVEAADSHYQQALSYCPPEENKERSSILFNHAQLIAQQGDIDQALDLYAQSRQIKEQINDVKGKAATLHAMAGILAQQGDIDQALDLYAQSRQIKEQINDVKGKAATLANMAYWAGKQGDRPRQLELNLQAAQALGQVRAYLDLFTVLSNLGATGETHSLEYRAQAVWLLLRIQAPLVDAMLAIKALYEAVPQGDDLEALLATFALFLCAQRGQEHPQIEQLQELSMKMLSGAATAQGIETQEAFDTWYAKTHLDDPDIYLPRLNECLEALIADTWAFDPTPLRSKE